MNRVLRPTGWLAIAVFLLSFATAGPGLSAREPMGGQAESSSSAPCQYRGPVGDPRERRAAPMGVSPGPAAGGGSHEGKDRWEFWFEYEKDALLRRALESHPALAVAEPGSPATVAHVTIPLRPVDIKDRLLPALRAALLDPDAAVRVAAASALGNARDRRSLPSLVSELRGGMVEGRRAAALALGLLGDTGANPVLTDALGGDPDAETRSRAAFALGLIGDPGAVMVLRQAVERNLRGSGESRSEHIADLVVGLGLAGDKGQGAFLQKLVAAPNARDWRILAAAAWALGCIEDPAAIRPLRSALGEARDPRVRRAVTLALGRFRDPSAIEGLDAVLATDSDSLTRGLACVSLARVGGARSVPALAELTGAKLPRTTRGFAAIALGLTEDAATAGPLLLKLLELGSEDSVRGAAAVGLGLLRYGAAADDLRRIVRDSASSPALRGHALLGIALTGDPAVPALLREMLVADGVSDPARGAALGAGLSPFPGSDLLLIHVLGASRDPTVRGAAILGLGLAADRGVLALLVDTATDTDARDPLARLQAVTVLGQLALEGRLPPVARIAAGAGWHDLTAATADVTRGF